MATSKIDRSSEILFNELSTPVSDLNTYYTGDAQRIRILRWGGSNTAHTPVNINSGFCISYWSSANYACQLAMVTGSTRIYTRECSGGTWGAWKSVNPA